MKKLIQSVLVKSIYIFCLLTIGIVAVHGQTFNEVEPNNTFAQANTVSTNTNISLAMNPSSDNDYFKVNLTRCGVLTLKLSNVPSNQSIRLYVYKTDQTQIGYAYSPTQGTGFTYDILLEQGISYIRVYNASSTSSSAQMQLKISLDNGDLCECNNSFSSACTVPYNTTLRPQLFGENSTLGGADEDYYKVEYHPVEY